MKLSFALYDGNKNHKIKNIKTNTDDIITFIRNKASELYPDVKQGEITTYLNTYTIHSDKYRINVIIEG